MNIKEYDKRSYKKNEDDAIVRPNEKEIRIIKITKCIECVYFTHNGSFSHDKKWKCGKTNRVLGARTMYGSSMISKFEKEGYKIPNWCPLDIF